jgi:hypothetical protein
MHGSKMDLRMRGMRWVRKRTNRSSSIIVIL